MKPVTAKRKTTQQQPSIIVTKWYLVPGFGLGLFLDMPNGTVINGPYQEKQILDAIKNRKDWTRDLNASQARYSLIVNNKIVKHSQHLQYPVRVFLFNIWGPGFEGDAGVQQIRELSQVIANNVAPGVLVPEKDSDLIVNANAVFSDFIGNVKAASCLIERYGPVRDGWFKNNTDNARGYFREGGTIPPHIARALYAPNNEVQVIDLV